MWTPPPNVTEHQGAALTPGGDFFVDPPPEIGPIRTAHTTLKQGVKPRSGIMRIAIALAWGLAVEGVLIGIDYGTSGVDPATGFFSHEFRSVEELQTVVYLAPVAILVAIIAWLLIRFRHTVSYVGDLGCADYACKRRTTRITRKTVFLFSGAHSVTTSATEHYKNTAYVNTTFGFNWYASPQAKAVYWITGSHTSHNAPPPLDNIYHFARSAETAFYYFVAPQIEAELAQQGRVRFYTGHNGWAALGPGFIEITDRNGQVSRFNAGEIAVASTVNHTLQLFRPGVFFNPLDFSKREGVYKFDLTSHNLPMFRLLFKRCMGIDA